ncbi:WecB/TagA/CpsF family glycosyltransferase [Antarcticirhabdus aurantiaca]|uniref:WecB/TagA/CpsF family glycosyltransferase n=1 Tax=Antarcticirhabdus aurantiaca TaxID=2606717 RepID=A0ACD4NMW8_9HYPH|nr:WecB/TagA/CpsF family glycosyltransferase [Antarcticirhabdus aurantiaca]WAJ27961.1 WecB/TagA/CpsF family glycosyltransferase [Jeongeuplla avenae]
MSKLASINLLGIRVSALDLPGATNRILDAVAAGERGYVCVTGAHGVVEAQRDERLRTVHNDAFLVTPDGMPLVWALRGHGHRHCGRVYGPDLMADLIDRGRERGLKHFLYGATPATLQRLEARLAERYPGVEIAGSWSPPFRPLSAGEDASVAKRIDASGADIVWVGLGTPKQELWMARMRERLRAPMLVGVGAAFDFHAGTLRQAPRFVQRSGFEWAFRLACEPRRLWRRYAVTVPAFIGLNLAQMLRLRDFPTD